MVATASTGHSYGWRFRLLRENFVYATHATQAIAIELKLGLTYVANCLSLRL